MFIFLIRTNIIFGRSFKKKQKENWQNQIKYLEIFEECLLNIFTIMTSIMTI